MHTILLLSLIASAFSTPVTVSESRPVWQPAVGTKWQIEIWTQVDTSKPLSPADALVYDVDLFYHSQDQIATMKAQNKKIICYFSAGTAEVWRPDYDQFSKSDIGNPLEDWPGESYLNIRSPAVLDIMKKRIQLAASKGCDAVDPDNVDAFSNDGGGFNITQSDTVTYVQKMAAEARKNGLATGLKNAQEILPKVLSDVQFAVNEECVVGGQACQEYNNLLAAGKPVFHIEYVNITSSGQWTNPAFPNQSNSQLLETLCDKKGKGGIANKLSTVIKNLDLDGWVTYCDGTEATTALNSTYDTGDPKQEPPPSLRLAI